MVPIGTLQLNLDLPLAAQHSFFPSSFWWGTRSERPSFQRTSVLDFSFNTFYLSYSVSPLGSTSPPPIEGISSSSPLRHSNHYLHFGAWWNMVYPDQARGLSWKPFFCETLLLSFQAQRQTRRHRRRIFQIFFLDYICFPPFPPSLISSLFCRPFTSRYLFFFPKTSSSLCLASPSPDGGQKL